MKILRIITLAVLALGMCNAGFADRPAITKLAVLLNYDTPGVTKSEDLVSVLRSDSADPRSAALRLRFQNAQSARLLISNRLATQFRNTLGSDHPDELLHRYIVLEFRNEVEAMAAKSALQRDATVLFVRESMYADFSAIPSDPYYALAPRIQDYQWATNNTLGLQQAWNSVRGTAFLAHLDNGVQSNTLHPDLTQAFRRSNFNVDGTFNVNEDPTATGVGHGTATAGVMAASTAQASVPTGYPNPASDGIAGVCWYCNLMIAKISRTINTRPSIDDVTDVPNALNWAANSGAQVVNMSFGGSDHNCAGSPNDPLCLALDSAARKEVMIAAATGNSNRTQGGDGNAIGTVLQFPASDSRTIAVGAIQSYVGTRGNLWTEETLQTGFVGSSGGPGMTTRGVLAPGRDVLSSFYTGTNWNVAARCGTDATFPSGGQGTSHGPNHGICTGTSLAAPHIAAAIGLLRSINPLLSPANVTSYLLNSGDNAGSPSSTRGFGVPNLGAAVNAVLNTTNRLTPLLSMYSSSAWDYFYTVVPQQGRAAATAQLLPFPVGAAAGTFYSAVGNSVPGLSNYPDTILRPLAQVWIFTTFVNPANASVELKPLYRLSWRCGDGAQSVCPSNPNHVSHFYSADLSETQSYISGGFSFDGIEGYVYPVGQTQPPGTTALMRAYNASRDGYAVFPQELQSSLASEGYTLLLSTIGYAYFNNGTFPTY